MVIIDNMQSVNQSITDFEFQVKTPILSTNKFNIGKQAKIAEKEAAKQAKIAEKEAAKQAVKQAKIAEKKAIQKRRERVREIKRLYKIQAAQTDRHLRQYHDEENRIVLENYHRRQREIRLRQSEERALERSRQRIENEGRALVGSLIVSADVRRSTRTRQITSRTVSRDLLTRGLPNAEQPVNVPRERVRRQPVNVPRERVRRQPVQTLNQERWAAVNPVQELINQDLNGCNKPLDQLVCCETAYKVDECPICFETIGETNNMILRCGHQVCGDCIIHHLQMVGGMKCPVCREQVGVRVKYWIPPAPKRVVNRR